jgi:hypothetical protein
MERAMKENCVVAAGRETDRIDVLDPVGEAAGEARFLRGPLGLGDGFRGEVDALDAGTEALGQDVPLEEAGPAADRQPEGKGAGAYSRRTLIGQRLGSPVTRRLMALGPAAGSPIGSPQLAGTPASQNSRAAAASGARPSPRSISVQGGERIADGRRHYWETRSSVADMAFWRNPCALSPEGASFAARAGLVSPIPDETAALSQSGTKAGMKMPLRASGR